MFGTFMLNQAKEKGKEEVIQTKLGFNEVELYQMAEEDSLKEGHVTQITYTPIENMPEDQLKLHQQLVNNTYPGIPQLFFQ